MMAMTCPCGTFNSVDLMGVTLTRINKQTAEDPYASMEKDQLISMIHFLVKREDERAQENQELKDMVKDLRDTHKQDVKTQTNLLKSIDRLTNQVADLTTQNRMISERIAELAQTLPSRD